MTEEYTNATLIALERQRNNALNGLVKAEAAITIAQSRISELEAKVTELKNNIAELKNEGVPV